MQPTVSIFGHFLIFRDNFRDYGVTEDHPITRAAITVMRRLTTEIRSEKCIFRQFRRCANVTECSYTNLDSIAYYTPRLYGIAYCS